MAFQKLVLKLKVRKIYFYSFSVLYEKQNCEVEIFDTCKQSSQIGIRRQYNEMRKFVGCNNLYEI